MSQQKHWVNARVAVRRPIPADLPQVSELATGRRRHGHARATMRRRGPVIVFSVVEKGGAAVIQLGEIGPRLEQNHRDIFVAGAT